MTQAAVIGCGIMGSGITFVARAAGFPVTRSSRPTSSSSPLANGSSGSKPRPGSGAPTWTGWPGSR
jgi:predicted dinucleotide-binding enzyme